MSADVPGFDTRLVGRQLRRAREALALSLTQVAESTGFDAGDLSRWESGEAQPQLDALWELADIYGRTTDFFFRDLPPAPSRIKFRLARPGRGLKRLSPAARRALVEFEGLCRRRYELEEILDSRPRVWPQRGVAGEAPESLAAEVRRQLGLGSEPIPDLRTVLEEKGVRIFAVPVPESEFAGFSWWHPVYGPCIMVNARDPSGRRNFTIAHEYFHLITESQASLCDLSIAAGPERFANRFAAAFLMPELDVRAEWGKRGLLQTTLTLSQVGALARRYRSSSEAMVLRLAEMDLIGEERREELLEGLAAAPRVLRRPRSAVWHRRLGQRHVSLAGEAYKRGHISLGALADCLGVSVVKAAQIARELGEERDSAK